jgi:hypothetical protein
MGCLARTIGMSSALAILALGAAPAFAQTPTLRIRHAAARVVIQAENRTDIAVSVSGGASRPRPLTVRREGGAVVVDAGLDTHSMSCGGEYSLTHLFGGIDHVRDTRRVKLAGVGWVNVSDLPVITVHAPRAVAVSAEGAVWGAVGATEALSLDAGGCGDWRIGAVRGRLGVHVAGSADIQGETAGALDVSLAGSGDVALHNVAGPVRIDLAGSGDVHLGTVVGAIDARLAGSGGLVADRVEGAIKAKLAGSSNMKINGGHAPQLSVQIAGSGDFVFNGVAGSVSAAVAGSGDIHVAHADGPVAKSVIGSGEIAIGR